jgi:hypothetical protein
MEPLSPSMEDTTKSEEDQNPLDTTTTSEHLSSDDSMVEKEASPPVVDNITKEKT